MAAQSTTAAGASGTRQAPLHYAQSESVKEKKDLASWWKNFKRSDKKGPEQAATPQGIFGIPLQASIRYANVAISLFNDEGHSYIYGYVPIVVAKCGVFLKEKATDVEGIFRLAGSEKRIKELKIAFDSPDRYGKGLDWTGYTVHDAANILRRYFNQLPEPIIPLEFYQKFRNPLRNHQAQAVGAIETQSPSEGEFDHEGAIRAYQGLITELPPLNRQLLLYILDLLAVFASKSDLNKMTTPNLAAIFQPGILNHPQHDMAPQEYRLSQDVLIFLIENQDSFLIGMSGTAADPETVREVQSGSPAKTPSTSPTPNRSKTVIGRSGSNSSVAAESVRKWGSIRRNVSVSSKNSKRSDNVPQPGSPATTPPVPASSGVHRSNTVPSRRAGSATQSPRFPREKYSDPTTPSAASPNVFTMASVGQRDHSAASERPAVGLAVVNSTIERSPSSERQGSLQSTPIATHAPQDFPPTNAMSPATSFPLEVTSASSSEATTPLAIVGSGTSSATVTDHQTTRRETTPLLAPGRLSSDRSTDRSASNTPSSTSGRKFLDILKQSPHSESEGRKPNKLQKKRGPGTSLSSAHSSAQSLDDPNERHGEFSSQSPISSTHATIAEVQNDSAYDMSAGNTLQTVPGTPQRHPTETTLRPAISPSTSFHSHTDTSDADMVGDDMPPHDSDQPEKKKRSRWRFSRTQNKLDQPSTPGNPLGTMTEREQAMSRSTIGSGGSQSQPRQSFQEPTRLASVATDPAAGLSPEPRPIQPAATSDMVFSDSERERKGPMSWLRNKIQERKEKDAEKRSETPERGRHERSKSKLDLRDPDNAMLDRGRSFEQPRSSYEAKDINRVVPGNPPLGADSSQTVKANGERFSESVASNAGQRMEGRAEDGQRLVGSSQ